jgi:hypothetical protein
MVDMALLPLLSYPIFMPKPSTHRMHDPGSIVSHIRPKVFTDNPNVTNKVCPRGCGPGPPALVHRSTDFIKRRPLASRSMTQIEPSEPVSRLLISAVHHQSDGRGGWLRPGVAQSRACGGASWLSVAAHRSSSFLELRRSVFNEVCSYGFTMMMGT